MTDISQKQRRMLAFIEGFVEEKGYPPTYEEIRVGMEISSKSLVNYHLKALEEAACITRAPNTPRGIQLAAAETVNVPLKWCGDHYELADGEQRKAIALTQDIVPGSTELYALKIRGSAMLDALVNDGDIVVLKPQQRATNGEMVAVRVEGQTMLKRYYRENGHVRLQAANPMVREMTVAPEQVDVEGKVVAVIRQVQ